MQRSQRTLLPAVMALLALVAGGGASAASLPAAVAAEPVQLQKVGDGRLSWLGFPIYHASLWTQDGRYDGFSPGEPVALSLWYERSFSRDQLIDITDKAWGKLGMAETRRQDWLAELRRVFRDVAPGHNMTVVVLPGERTRFFDHRGLLGEVSDVDFGPAFLSIWLDPRSPVRDLRVQLIGGDAGR
jgi:hypothetical protein